MRPVPPFVSDQLTLSACYDSSVEFRRKFDPKIAAADAIETTNDCSAERASMSGFGRCLEMRGSRLANWLLPRDSFAERALWNGRCWRKAAVHAPGCYHEACCRSPD